MVSCSAESWAGEGSESGVGGADFGGRRGGGAAGKPLRHVLEFERPLAQLEQQIQVIGQEQERIRQNMTQLGRDTDGMNDIPPDPDSVVVINDYLKDGRRTIDIRPWFLVKQDGKWKLARKS